MLYKNKSKVIIKDCFTLIFYFGYERRGFLSNFLETSSPLHNLDKISNLPQSLHDFRPIIILLWL